MLLLENTDKIPSLHVPGVGTNNPDESAGWINITHIPGLMINGIDDLAGFIDRLSNKT